MMLIILLIINIIMHFNNVQFHPDLFKAELFFVIFIEIAFIVLIFKERAVFTACMAVLLIIIVISLLCNKSYIYKTIDGKDCIGVYDSITGIGETQVTYYEIINSMLISSNYYCIENYDIVLAGELNFESNPPYSVEYFAN